MVNDRPIKILLVEDETAYARLVQEVLMSALSFPFEVVHTGELKGGLEQLKGGRFDVVLLDLTLPDAQGLLTYAQVHALAPSVPIVTLTGVDDEKLALQAVRDGAQDYLVKGQLDGKMLARVIRYAIERKRAAEALRQSEEFFRLISENVTDLIAVIDRRGRRLYNSPSYKDLLGDPSQLIGSDSFEEVHDEDRERVKRIFQNTLATGIGSRAEYRMVLKDGSVRYIESHGSAVRDESGGVTKVIVVSRDITERVEAVQVLRNALSDLKKSHEELQAAQRLLIQSEKLEAVSTFAAGVAHEVKNPLQTVILGVDYLNNHVAKGDATAAMVLGDMANAVAKADGIIHGLLEFSSARQRDVKEEHLGAIAEQALQAVEIDVINRPIKLIKELDADLPPLRLDGKTMKHVFINLLMHALRETPGGGKLLVRAFTRRLQEPVVMNGRGGAIFKAGETVVGVLVQEFAPPASAEASGGTGRLESAANTCSPLRGEESGLGLTVLKKIVELYGGVLEMVHNRQEGNRYTVLFKAQQKT